jgi:hypothetical protein
VSNVDVVARQQINSLTARVVALESGVTPVNINATANAFSVLAGDPPIATVIVTNP